jgi:DNA replication protein DnaC
MKKAFAAAKAFSRERERLLRGGGSRLALRFARIGGGIFPAEALDAACRIHQLLLAGKERVAVGADFQMQLLALVGGAGVKAVATGALHFNFVVAGVDSLFWHRFNLSRVPGLFPGVGAETAHAAACRVGSIILCGISSGGNRSSTVTRPVHLRSLMVMASTSIQRSPQTTPQECELCGGTGLRVERNQDGARVAVRCDCQTSRMAGWALRQAQVPKRYEHCTLENYDAHFRNEDRSPADPSIAEALLKAKGFVEAYPVGTDGKGLLLVGSIGVGKTHLAVGILEALVREKGANGLFCDYRDLLKQVQNSYSPNVAATELDVLRPVFDAEVLVLDELGASKPTEWVWDTVAHILNTRYNDRRTTIFTTNYPNLPSAGAAGIEPSGNLRKAVREETLGDRIGDRMRSRLQEMCATVTIYGQDMRQTLKRARF